MKKAKPKFGFQSQECWKDFLGCSEKNKENQITYRIRLDTSKPYEHIVIPQSLSEIKGNRDVIIFPYFCGECYEADIPRTIFSIKEIKELKSKTR